MNIAFKKTALLKTFGAGLLLIAASVFLMTIEEVGNPVFDNFAFKYILPIVAILFFGTAMLFIVGRLFSSTPALVLSTEGFTDRASIFAPGFIGWEEVAGLATTSLANQEFLVVMLRDPQKVIDRQSNALIALGLKLNYKNYGSPCYIPVQNLDCSLDALLANFRQHLGQ
jgi:hypothetical protein